MLQFGYSVSRGVVGVITGGVCPVSFRYGLGVGSDLSSCAARYLIGVCHVV